MPAKKNTKQWLPKNVRDMVLKGFDLAEGFCIYEEDFAGASIVLRRGTFEPDGTDLEIPFVAKISYGKPRPVLEGGK
jgi:hypothetical protein